MHACVWALCALVLCVLELCVWVLYALELCACDPAGSHAGVSRGPECAGGCAGSPPRAPG